MPNIKINGVEYSFPRGMNVFEACQSVGIYIPHFCYHPVLKVVGSCRMCKVEVIQNERSRIDISCNLEVMDGIEILTESEAVKKARQMTMEFLLANHPLDCPVCDDAGECGLQNYYLEYGQHDSRTHELKIRKRKATDIGRSIVLDSERCVLCSRCVRFLSEITHTNELGIFGMGSTEELMVKPDARVDNDYAGNVVDLCPVGALTDKDFRFKRRVWYLNMTSSICQHCSRGCNVRIDHDTNPFHDHKRHYQMSTHRSESTEYQRIQRIKPRANEAVNGHWICDHGRYGYRETDSADRLTAPFIRVDDELRQVSIQEAIRTIAKGVIAAQKGTTNKVAVVISPRSTNEEVFAVWSLFGNKLKIPNLDHRIPPDMNWYGDDLLRTPDPFPNRTGCEWIGFVPDKSGIGVEQLSDEISSGKIDTLVSVLTDPSTYVKESQLKRLKRKYIITRCMTDSVRSWADVLLPAAGWGEYRGTFTNFQGRIQLLDRAFEPLGESVPVWRLMVDLSAAMKKHLGWQTPEAVFKSLGNKVHIFQGITLDTIGPEGVNIGSQQLKATG